MRKRIIHLQNRRMHHGITNEQLERTTQLINYDVSMNETCCPISSDAFEPGQQLLKINMCGHVFSENELREWCSKYSSCPLCGISLKKCEESL